MDNLEGGFVIHRAPAILSGLHKHTLALPGRPVSDYDLEATNRIQATPWRINRRVLSVARQLFLDEVDTPAVPGNKTVPVPGRRSDAEWATLGEDAKRQHRAAIAKAHQENASLIGQRQGFLESLDTATTMEDHESFWFPWTHDFRLRRYPVACGGLTPQGNDFTRALMMFARGKPLGPSGFYWLCVRLANAMGQDKAPLDERVEWVMDRMDVWMRVCDEPAKRLAQWQDADSPWEALATIFEVSMAFTMPDGRTEEFVSHLPVPMDGSCNGLQHLSAMGLDPVGALATNLTPCPTRQDIYLQVRDAAKARVEQDAARGIPEALVWLGKVERDTVKRGVLATPYGVTDGGLQRQLLDDRKVPHSDTVTALQASAYFRDVMVYALTDTVVAAKQIMAWLQACGQRLTEAGRPMEWVTPTGSTIRQAYRRIDSRQVVTLVGEIRLVDEVDDGVLDARKQALGSSPNVVHSFDAAHLARTVNTLGRHYGIQDFAMVHDSFAVHACDTPTLHAVLRREFVDIYSENWLDRLAGNFLALAPGVDLPPPPPRGTFDITQVLDAPFFFA